MNEGEGGCLVPLLGATIVGAVIGSLVAILCSSVELGAATVFIGAVGGAIIGVVINALMRWRRRLEEDGWRHVAVGASEPSGARAVPEARVDRTEEGGPPSGRPLRLPGFLALAATGAARRSA